MAIGNSAIEPVGELKALRSRRRILEGASYVCIAYHWLDIRLRTHSLISGFPVHVGSTRYLPAVLWLALAWSAWRYGQQLYRTSYVAKGQIVEDYTREVERLGRRIVQRYIAALPAPQRQRLADRYADGRMTFPPDVTGTVESAAAPFEATSGWFALAENDAPPEGGIEFPIGPHARDFQQIIKARVLWKSGGIQNRVDVRFGITRNQGRILRARAWIAAGLRAPAIVDYLAPMALWAFAVISMALSTFC